MYKKSGMLFTKKLICLFIVLSVVTIIISLSNLLFPYSLKWIVDQSKFIPTRNIEHISIVLIALIFNISKFSSDIKLKILSKIDKELSLKLSHEFLNFILFHQNENKKNNVLHAFEELNKAIKSILYDGFQNLLPFLIDCIILLLFMFNYMPQLYWIYFFVFFVSYLFFSNLHIKKALTVQKETINKSLNLFGFFTQVIFSQKDIGSFNEEKCISKKGQALIGNYNTQMYSTMHYFFKSSYIGTLIKFLFCCFFFLILKNDIQSNIITIGEAVFILTYLTYIFKPLDSIVQIYINVTRSLVTYEKISEEFFKKVFTKIQNKIHKQIKINKKNNITLDNVSFYSHGKEILSNINLNVVQGKTIALKGISGSGKTTLGLLLNKQLSPNVGIIKWGDQNFDELDKHNLREEILYVSHNCHIYGKTVKEFLFIGDVDEQEVNQLIKVFFQNSKTPCQHILRKNILELSSGEKQRVIIIKALTKKRSFYIWDEVTANLDMKMKHIVFSHIALKKSSTHIFITHDEFIAKKCEEEISLKSGVINTH